MQETMTVFDVFTVLGIGVYVDDTKRCILQARKRNYLSRPHKFCPNTCCRAS